MNIIAVLVVSVANLAYSLSWSSFFLSLLLGTAISLSLRNKDRVVQKNTISAYVALSFFVIGVCLIHQAQYSTPMFTSSYNDDSFFQNQAKIMYEKRINNFIDYRYHNNSYVEYPYSFYIWLLSKLYAFGALFDGYSNLMPRILNVFFAAMIEMLMLSFAKKELSISEKRINLIGKILFLFPPYIYILSFAFRDTLCALLFLLVAINSYGILNRNSKQIVISIIIIGGSVFLTYFVRPALSYCELTALCVCLLFTHPGEKKTGLKQMFKIISFILIIAAVAFSGIKSVIAENSSNALSYSGFRVNEATSSGSLVNLIYSVPLLPFGIVIRAIFSFMIYPPSFMTLFGSNALSYRLLFSVLQLSSIIALSSLIFVIRGAKRNLIVTCFYLIALASFIASGTFRHLQVCYPLLALLIGLGAEQRTKDKNEYDWIVCFSSICLLFIAYSIAIIIL